MRRNLIFSLVLSLTAAAVHAQTPAAVSPAPTPGFCLFAHNAAVINTRAGMSARASIGQIENTIATNNARDRNVLIAESNTLNSQRGRLTPADLQSRGAQLQQRAQQLDAATQTLTRQLTAARDNAQNRIDTAINPVLAQVRLARGCAIVMERNAAYYFPTVADLTAEVVQRVDASLPPFSVGLQALPAAPGR